MNAAMLVLATMLLAGCDVDVRHVGVLEHESKAVDMAKFESGRLEVKMGAGELRLSGGSPKMLEADFDFNVRAWKPIFTTHTIAQRADIKIEQPSGGPIGDVKYEWAIKLNDQVPWDVVTNLGAGEAHLDLGSVALRKVEVHMGVGQLHLDLRGTPKRSYEVDVNGGVGEATVLLPKSANIVATAHGGIGEINVQGLEHHGDRWMSGDSEKSPVTIHLNANGGVGSIRISAE
jgi:N-terminal domain of toast_rack, DUF2154